MTNPVENKINRAAESVEPSAEFTQKLWSQIKKTPIQTQEPKRVNRRVWIPAATVLGLLLILVISAPQTVFAAVRSLLAYLPGTGFVTNSESSLYLADPVVAIQGDYSMTLDQVVANTEKVVVTYHLAGLPASASSCIYDANLLVLPDGKTMHPIGGGVNGVNARVEFAPLPEGVTQAFIQASMNFPDANCTAIPQEWKVAFTLGTVAPDAELLPVIENSAAQTASAVPTDGTSVQMMVDRSVELSDGYLLTGHLAISNEDWKNAFFDMDSISAVDVNGKAVAVLPTDEDFGDNEFSIKIAGKDFVGPLTINVKNLWIWAKDNEGAVISFDAGEEPHIGQSWNINKELTVADKKILVQDVKMVENDSQSNQSSAIQGYSVQISGKDTTNMNINCSGQQKATSLFGQTRPIDSQTLLVENFYPEGIPTGEITCNLKDVQFKEAGDWSFEWQPVSAAK